MKLATYLDGLTPRVGVVDTEHELVRPILDNSLGGDMTAIVSSAHQVDLSAFALGAPVSLAAVQLQAPIPRPRRNIICVGKNYRAHAKEFAASGFDSSAADVKDAVPDAPIFFTKTPETVIAQGESIRLPHGVSSQIDYEAELAIVIGRKGRSIKAKDAYAHVFGYTIVNDVTARDLQALHKQWFLGKSLDSFCPMGPWLATSDEFNPDQYTIRCWVNQELRQDANFKDLIFDIPTLIEVASAGMTLLPGDIIATGTPEGVGIGFKPPRFLKRGDQVKIEVSGIGTLLNDVR